MKDAIRKARAIFSQVKLTQEPLSDGSIIQYDTDTITIGEPIFLMDPQGDFSVLPDGDYKTKNNASFTIKDGVCSAYTPSMSTSEDDSAETETKEQAQSAAKDTTIPDEDPDNVKQNDTESNQGKDAPASEGAFADFEDEYADSMVDEAKKPYGEIEYADKGYRTDKRYRYPIDTEEHIRAAWNYINKPDNAALYSANDLVKVKDNIIAAWKKVVDKAGPPSVAEKKDQKAADQAPVETPNEEAIDQKQISDMIAQALAPVMQAIAEIRTMCENYAAECKTVNEQMSAVKTKVEVLSKQPAGPEIQETSRFIKPSKDIMDNRAIKLMRPDLS